MELPRSFVARVLRDLGEAEGGALCAALDTVPPVSVRLNPAKCTPAVAGMASDNLSAGFPHLAFARRVPWCDAGWYLAERPSFTFDSDFHAGA